MSLCKYILIITSHYITNLLYSKVVNLKVNTVRAKPMSSPYPLPLSSQNLFDGRPNLTQPIYDAGYPINPDPLLYPNPVYVDHTEDLGPGRLTVTLSLDSCQMWLIFKPQGLELYESRWICQ